MGVLWIFFKKYSLAGRTFLDGEQKATISLSSSPFLRKSSSMWLIPVQMLLVGLPSSTL